MNQTTDKSFFYLIHDVTRLARKHFDRRAAGFELTRAQWMAIKRLHRNEGISQTELADQLDMESIAVGRVIDRLEQAGFIERRADRKDRRRWNLHLLPKAQAVIGDMEVIAAGLRNEATRGVAPVDMDALYRVLEQIKQNLLALDQPPLSEESP